MFGSNANEITRKHARSFAHQFVWIFFLCRFVYVESEGGGGERTETRSHDTLDKYYFLRISTFATTYALFLYSSFAVHWILNQAKTKYTIYAEKSGFWQSEKRNGEVAFLENPHYFASCIRN